MTAAILTCAFVFWLGLCVGSFLNVCIYRLPRGMSLTSPSSHCPTCNESIAWYDNIPVVSWLALGGLCRRCGVRISPRCLLVELLTSAVFLWIYAVHRVPPPPRIPLLPCLPFPTTSPASHRTVGESFATQYPPRVRLQPVRRSKRRTLRV